MLDLYLPTTGSGPFPLVIMVHGGGFMFGDKADGGGEFETAENLAMVIAFLDTYLK